MMREELTIIRAGDEIAEEEETLYKPLDDFVTIESYKVPIHDGGRSATKVAALLDIKDKMIGGRRITDAETLRVVAMVYGELVNKNIVVGLQVRGVNALGPTGADMDVIRSVRRLVREIDYGFVGNVKQVSGDFSDSLIRKSVASVIAPLTHDGEGHMLNTNANTIAGEMAKVLSEQFDMMLVYCFEKKDMLRDESDNESVTPQITPEEFKQYVVEGAIRGGMIPKLESSFEALSVGVTEVIITLALAIDSAEGTHVIK